MLNSITIISNTRNIYIKHYVYNAYVCYICVYYICNMYAYEYSACIYIQFRYVCLFIYMHMCMYVCALLQITTHMDRKWSPMLYIYIYIWMRVCVCVCVCVCAHCGHYRTNEKTLFFEDVSRGSWQIKNLCYGQDSPTPRFFFLNSSGLKFKTNCACAELSLQKLQQGGRPGFGGDRW